MTQPWQPKPGDRVTRRRQPTGQVVDVERTGRHRVLVRWSEGAPPVWHDQDDLTPAPAKTRRA